MAVGARLRISSSGRDTRAIWPIAAPLRQSRTARHIGLEHQVGNEGGEIGVAAAFAQPVQRALDLARAGAHRRQRFATACSVSSWAWMPTWSPGILLADLADDLLDLVRERAAVGVAEHDPAGAGLVGGPGAGKRVGRVRLVAIEEMLAVEQHLAALCRGRAHAVADRGEVLLCRWSRARRARGSPRLWRRNRPRRPRRRGARQGPDRSTPNGRAGASCRMR